jgi:hypothetical protein
MSLALFAKKVDHSRSISNGRFAGLNFAVKDSEGIGVKPPLTIFTELKRLLRQELFQFLPIPRPAVTTAQRIDLKFEFFKPNPLQEMEKHENDLNIHHGVLHTKDLCIDLIELSITALLRPFITKHRANAIEFCNRVEGVELVL